MKEKIMDGGSSNICILGGVFFSLIVVGAAINGDFSLLWAFFVAFLYCLFFYYYHKKGLREKAKRYVRNDSLLTNIVVILMILVFIFLAKLPGYLKSLIMHFF
jgi:hypothetical protein